jgi:hypothetical protein
MLTQPGGRLKPRLECGQPPGLHRARATPCQTLFATGYVAREDFQVSGPVGRDSGSVANAGYSPWKVLHSSVWIEWEDSRVHRPLISTSCPAIPSAGSLASR